MNFAKDVGAAEEAAVEQGALRDRLDAGFHGAAGFFEDAAFVHAAEVEHLADFFFEEF